MMAWPRADGDWAPYLPAVRACYRELCAAISRHAPVLLLSATPEATAQELAHLGTGRLRVWASPAQDTWTRDYGPITVLESRGPEGEAPLLLDFRFNGWGGKYQAGGDNRATAGERFLRLEGCAWRLRRCGLVRWLRPAVCP